MAAHGEAKIPPFDQDPAIDEVFIVPRVPRPVFHGEERSGKNDLGPIVVIPAERIPSGVKVTAREDVTVYIRHIPPTPEPIPGLAQEGRA